MWKLGLLMIVTPNISEHFKCLNVSHVADNEGRSEGVDFRSNTCVIEIASLQGRMSRNIRSHTMSWIRLHHLA